MPKYEIRSKINLKSELNETLDENESFREMINSKIMTVKDG